MPESRPRDARRDGSFPWCPGLPLPPQRLFCDTGVVCPKEPL
jgi:hypothetical protein